MHPDEAARLLDVVRDGEPGHPEFRFAPLPPGNGARILEILQRLPHGDNVVLVGRDVTAERAARLTLDRHREVLSLLTRQGALPAALDVLARSVETASGGGRVAVLLVRGDDLELVAGRACAPTRPGHWPGCGARRLRVSSRPPAR